MTPLMDPGAIEKESFRIIDSQVGARDKARFNRLEWPVVRRAIHTTGDLEFHNLMHFSPGAVECGVKSLLEGKAVLADTQMLLAGITTGRLRALGVDAFSLISMDEVRELAQKMHITRSAASMDLLIDDIGVARDVGIVAIGNAPTALFRLLERVNEGMWRPRLVVGTPVGFVGAKESKEALMASGLPYITCVGTRGGSTVAASIVNQLAVQALMEKGK